MEFIDCNAAYGMDVAADDLRPAHTVDVLRAEMARAGVAKAVVWRVEQFGGSPVTANDLLAADIKCAKDLFGTWAIIPTHTHELPDPDKMPALMKAANVIGWRLFPSKSRFLPRAFVLRDWLEFAVERAIPIFVNTAHGTSLADLADIMNEFPQLTVVLTYASDWPSDRFWRPFVAEYPNLYIDLAPCITDGGVESFVAEYGSSRLLYGSGFPWSYFGANMLMVRHAGIPEPDRAAIAGGNMARIISEVSLD
jgi:predicted TIM-barrel fold metal-dependent hydrolase